MLFAFAARCSAFCLLIIKRHLARFAILLVAFFACARASAAGDSIDLRPLASEGTFRQARILVEVEGKLKLNADGKEIKHLPLKVSGELNYLERVQAQTKN